MAVTTRSWRPLNTPPCGAGQYLPARLISADSHVTDRRTAYIDRIDPAFRDRAPKVVRDADGGDVFVIDGMASAVPLGIVAAAGKGSARHQKKRVPRRDLHRGGWDGKARLADQDRDGIAAEIIYPSVGMVICNHPDADYKHACMWAYNRWLQEEFCAAAPDRLFGMGQTAVRSVAEAIEEFQSLKEMGFKGVMMPGNPAPPRTTTTRASTPCGARRWNCNCR